MENCPMRKRAELGNFEQTNRLMDWGYWKRAGAMKQEKAALLAKC